MTTYQFNGDIVRNATASEENEIGMQGIGMFEGRITTTIEADSREEAWEKARAKFAEYGQENGVKIINIGWTTESPAKDTFIHFRLSESEKELIKSEAKKQNRTVSNYILTLVKESAGK